MKNVIAGLLVGVGIAIGFLPILIASLLVKHNLFIEIIDRMDGYWKSLEQRQLKRK
jgi:hypothetical protein|tara:strand:+ start:22219 stop:22386 length:168 start_codon:yes stop_codon:yes gene_type:complete